MKFYEVKKWNVRNVIKTSMQEHEQNMKMMKYNYKDSTEKCIPRLGSFYYLLLNNREATEHTFCVKINSH